MKWRGLETCQLRGEWFKAEELWGALGDHCLTTQLDVESMERYRVRVWRVGVWRHIESCQFRREWFKTEEPWGALGDHCPTTQLAVFIGRTFKALNLPIKMIRTSSSNYPAQISRQLFRYLAGSERSKWNDSHYVRAQTDPNKTHANERTNARCSGTSEALHLISTSKHQLLHLLMAITAEPVH